MEYNISVGKSVLSTYDPSHVTFLNSMQNSKEFLGKKLEVQFHLFYIGTLIAWLQKSELFLFLNLFFFHYLNDC